MNYYILFLIGHFAWGSVYQEPICCLRLPKATDWICGKSAASCWWHWFECQGRRDWLQGNSEEQPKEHSADDRSGHCIHSGLIYCNNYVFIFFFLTLQQPPPTLSFFLSTLYHTPYPLLLSLFFFFSQKFAYYYYYYDYYYNYNYNPTTTTFLIPPLVLGQIASRPEIKICRWSRTDKQKKGLETRELPFSSVLFLYTFSVTNRERHDYVDAQAKPKQYALKIPEKIEYAVFYLNPASWAWRSDSEIPFVLQNGLHPIYLLESVCPLLLQAAVCKKTTTLLFPSWDFQDVTWYWLPCWWVFADNKANCSFRKLSS